MLYFAMRKVIYILYLVAAFGLSGNAQSIMPGVCPRDFTDCMTDHFHSRVKSFTETVYAVDFSRNTIQKGSQTSKVERTYDELGNIQTERTFDNEGTKLSGTLYQYRDSMKYVTTTHDAQGARTLQILYEQNDSNKLCTKMRLTDAIAITICTIRIRHEDHYVKTTETFNDGEVENTEYFYNKNNTLSSIIKDGDVPTTITLNYGKSVSNIFKTGNLLPQKMTVDKNGQKTVYTYTYQTDENGEWTYRQTLCDGKPVEIAERTIEYWE
ncbi:MAG: hypothetical protein MJZ15_06530 [Bacteroidales bacterium]|nr:hypothetical protein [Bacteroidales bacterium]